MEPFAIQLKESVGLGRSGEPVSAGIPLSRGSLHDCSKLGLAREDTSQTRSACFTPLCYWPDGSIRWLLAEFETDIQAGASQTLIVSETETPSNTEISIEATPEGWQINTAQGHLLLQSGLPAWKFLSQTTLANTEATLTDADNSLCQAVPDSDWHLHKNSPLFVEATLSGQWLRPDDTPLARFHCTLRISQHNGRVTADLQIHNPNRARHRGGLWDLGDEGSVLFSSLELVTTFSEPGIASLRPDAADKSDQTVTAAEIRLYQDSSGGENWDSVNHIDRNQALTTHFQGYRLSANNETIHGKRANPLLTVAGAENTIQIAMPGFWQNFPSSLSYREGSAVAGLFPQQPGNQLYELQGGERKTLRCLIGYHQSSGDLAWAYAPLTPLLAPEVYERAQAFPWFTTDTNKDSLDCLLREGLDGTANFFAKREVIDEYGWRNFGDLFADHECLYQPDDQPPLISHYNNQYDAVYGFARQFAATGDARWFELMNDLATHVTDIDIYHTTRDRAEYNNGLFWHTDHYLPAQTATHRTFSRHNRTSSTPGQTGGGPAEEHCYSTGLLYHYLLTGQAASRQAVLDLASWIVNLHEGSGTLLEQLLRIKRQDIPKIRSLLTDGKPTRHIYLFNRGTGNYLNTLLDAHLLEPEAGWLKKAENVIFGTIHPNDRIEERNLLTAETGWSYLVFLAAISRFLLVKEERQSHDEAYHYAKQSLRHYTRWMLANERTFLSCPDELEFANDTWVAQDMRKAMLLFQAAHWDPELLNQYSAKAVEIYNYVVTTLNQSPERALTRIQVILLQNYGPHQTMTQYSREVLDVPENSKLDTRKVSLTWTSLIVRIAARLAKGLTGFRLQNEQKWLATRVER